VIEAAIFSDDDYDVLDGCGGPDLVNRRVGIGGHAYAQTKARQHDGGNARADFRPTTFRDVLKHCFLQG
jgi:hypothetical protein